MVKIGAWFFRNGNNTYCVKIDGKGKTLFKGDKNEDNDKKAEQLRHDLLITYNALAKDEKANLTVNEAINAYLKEEKPNEYKKSWTTKVKQLDEFMKVCGDKKVEELDGIDIDHYIQSKKQWKNGTKQRLFRVLNSVFNSITYRKITRNNPCYTAKKYSSDVRGEDVAISADTFKTLHLAAKGSTKDLLTVFWQTGARPDEILGATVAEYNAANKSILKAKHKTSAKGKYRLIVLTDEADDIVRKYIGDRTEGYIFRTRTYTKILPGYWYQKLGRLARKAKIQEQVIPYGLRHGAACHWLTNGQSIEQVSAWLGHSSTAITQKHYAKLVYLLAGSQKALNLMYARPPVETLAPVG